MKKVIVVVMSVLLLGGMMQSSEACQSTREKQNKVHLQYAEQLAQYYEEKPERDALLHRQWEEQQRLKEEEEKRKQRQQQQEQLARWQAQQAKMDEEINSLEKPSGGGEVPLWIFNPAPTFYVVPVQY